MSIHTAVRFFVCDVHADGGKTRIGTVDFVPTHHAAIASPKVAALRSRDEILATVYAMSDSADFACTELGNGFAVIRTGRKVEVSWTAPKPCNAKPGDLIKSARFGEFGRYRLDVTHSIDGGVLFAVFDAAILDDRDRAAKIREGANLDEVLADFPDAFRLRPTKGDYVVNLGTVLTTYVGAKNDDWLLNDAAAPYGMSGKFPANPAASRVIRDCSYSPE